MVGDAFVVARFIGSRHPIEPLSEVLKRWGDLHSLWRRIQQKLVL
jgi:hypothetical protein